MLSWHTAGVFSCHFWTFCSSFTVKPKSTLNTICQCCFQGPWTAHFRIIDIRNLKLQLENHQILKMLRWHTGHSDIISMHYIPIVITVDLESILHKAGEALDLVSNDRWIIFLWSRDNPHGFSWLLVNNAWECTMLIIINTRHVTVITLCLNLECFYLMIWRWLGLCPTSWNNYFVMTRKQNLSCWEY